MKYINLSNEQFKEFITDPKTLNAIAFAHGVQQADGTKFFGTCTYPERYKVSEEQREHAAKVREERKKEKLKHIGNKLVFVGMGAQYASKVEGDICNHRIRTNIVNPEGRRFFLELGSGFHVLHSCDRDQEDEYNTKLIECRKKMTAKDFTQRTELWEEYQRYTKQPYYWHRKETYEQLSKELPYTKDGVLSFVNSLFGCKFKELEIDNYLLDCSEYDCISPK